GKLLGIATLWNPAMTGRSSGIGFGIPWDRIAAALPAMKEGKSFVYKNAVLGVQMSDDDGRVRIDYVRPGSPAEKAGIQVGDVLVEGDGHKITTVQSAKDAIRTHDAGETVKFTVRRAGREIEVDAVLEKSPDS